MEETIKPLVLVTGGTGMVGSNLKQLVNTLLASSGSKSVQTAAFDLNKSGGRNQELFDYLTASLHDHKHTFFFANRQDADLTNFNSTYALFQKLKPTFVIHLAAKVGGLYANMKDKVGFWTQNLSINSNVIKLSHQFGVKRLVCCLSSCIYPDKVPSYPIVEEWLHQGPPHPSNEGYAYAKRMCQVECSLYNEQYGTDFVCVVPTNLYGPFDNYSDQSSHVVPALIKRANQLSQRGEKRLGVFGTGLPLRQFCFAPDFATLLLWTLIQPNRINLISLLPEEECSIKKLAETVASEFGLTETKFDPSVTDGQYRKTMANTILRSYLPNFKFTSLEEGVKATVLAFK